VHVATFGTPATRATPTVMKALASSGNRPAGRYAPTFCTGTNRWPHTTPGTTSSSKSCSRARCMAANRFVRSAPVSRAARTGAGTWSAAPASSAAGTRRSVPVNPSSFAA
jgi:hypothetical protein